MCEFYTDQSEADPAALTEDEGSSKLHGKLSELHVFLDRLWRAQHLHLHNRNINAHFKTYIHTKVFVSSCGVKLPV